MSSQEKKSLKKQFFNYLIPSICAMWVFSLYTIIDGIFVGKYVGPSALAAVNISMPFINIIFAVSILFAIGSSTIIAMYLGKKQANKANSTFTLGLVCLITISIVTFILIYFNIDSFAYFLGAEPNNINLVLKYLKTIVFFNGFFMISYYLEVLCKTDGSPYLSIIAVGVAALTNVLLDYIFIAKLNMGIEGAAFATGLSQILSGAIFLSHFLSKRSTLKFAKFKINFKQILRIVTIGFPDSLTELAAGIVILLFNKYILMYIGENGVVAYSIISYTSSLVLMTMIGITQGMQPLVSYYFGKGSIKSVRYLFKMSITAILIASITTFLLTNVFTSSIVSIFIDGSDPSLNNLANISLKIYSLTFLLMGFNIIISGFFSAIEKPAIATVISLSRGIVIIIAVLFISTKLLGANGIWISTPITELLCLGISVISIKRALGHSLNVQKKVA
ncbi:MATE family efflux transporter [uncultured Clostridium sp.]|uniref:MATE family efflux transporter n=1 Tax=uncultured Clostridium sp. TaxID=59620 RepID=UPI00262775B8|nr:MATE family efflux transporter [uncultured Clostridium sp.]